MGGRDSTNVIKPFFFYKKESPGPIVLNEDSLRQFSQIAEFDLNAVVSIDNRGGVEGVYQLECCPLKVPLNCVSVQTTISDCPQLSICLVEDVPQMVIT